MSSNRFLHRPDGETLDFLLVGRDEGLVLNLGEQGEDVGDHQELVLAIALLDAADPFVDGFEVLYPNHRVLLPSRER